MIHETLSSEARNEPHEIDVESILQNPDELLEWLGEDWDTDMLGYNQREFSKRFKPGLGGFLITFEKDKDTGQIGASASLSDKKAFGHSRVHLPSVDEVIAYSQSGFKGMLQLHSGADRVEIFTQSMRPKMQFTTGDHKRFEFATLDI